MHAPWGNGASSATPLSPHRCCGACAAGLPGGRLSQGSCEAPGGTPGRARRGLAALLLRSYARAARAWECMREWQVTRMQVHVPGVFLCLECPFRECQVYGHLAKERLMAFSTKVRARCWEAGT